MAQAALPDIAVEAAVPKVIWVEETKAAMVVTSEKPEAPAPVTSMVSPTSAALKSAPAVVNVVLEAVVVPSVLLASEVRSHWAEPLIEACGAVAKVTWVGETTEAMVVLRPEGVE